MGWYKNLKIKAKMLIGFVMVALIAMVVGVVGLLELREVGTVRLPSVEDLDTIGLNLNTAVIGERGLINDSYTGDTWTAQLTFIEDSYSAIDEAMAEYEAIEKDNEELVLWNQFTDAYDTWKAAQQKVVELAQEVRDTDGKTEVQINTLKEQMMDQHFTAREYYLTANSCLEEMVHYNVSVAGTSVTRGNLMIIGFAAFGALLSIVLGFSISALISKPIIQMVSVAKRVAEYDLNVSMDYDAKDEIGELARAISVMVSNLNHSVNNVRSAAEQVASGSQQLSVSSRYFLRAPRAGEFVEELSASIEQIAAQTRENAKRSNEASDLALASQKDAVQGNGRMKEMLKAMDDINESSTNISKIIKVIDDIAFQTNILALNAAVEAARAGQHGKGFAVVAEEVRTLAARSADAAKETTSLIEGSMKKVEGGTRIASETAESLDKIVDGVTRAADLVQQITTASNEQSTGIEQINKAVSQVSDVIQTNSATSEESAAASEELSSQAELLKNAVGKYKLRGQAFDSYAESGGFTVREAGAEAGQKEAEKKKGKAPAKKDEIHIDLGEPEMGKY
jgi:methyl-accepting chemotaxis protein